MDQALLASLTAKYPMRILQNGNILTSPVRLSFADGLFKAKKIGTGPSGPKYGVSLLFPVGADLSILTGMANQKAMEKFGDPSKHKLSNPFLPQGAEPYEGYVDGGIFLRCYADEDKQPQLRDLQGRTITSVMDLYSGVWAVASVRCFAYHIDVKKGVSFGIQHVLKIADDQRLAGRSTADEDFHGLIEAAPGQTGQPFDPKKGAAQFF